MASYLLVQFSEITDEALFDQFRQRIAAISGGSSGKPIVQGGAVEICEGDWAPTRMAMREFENGQQARAWLESPQYAELRELRLKAAKASVMIVDGV